MRLSILIAVSSFAFLSAACAPNEPAHEQPSMIGMANPASVHCIQQGGRLEIRKQSGGGEYGVCLFNDGRQCEEWALLRENRCVPPK